MNGYFRKEGAFEPLSGYPVRNTIEAQGWGDEFAEEDGFKLPRNGNEASTSQDLTTQLGNLSVDSPIIGMMGSDTKSKTPPEKAQPKAGAKLEDMIVIQPGRRPTIDNRTARSIIAAIQA